MAVATVPVVTCALPIGNGPGGHRRAGGEFGDYWRMGLPLEVIVVAVATPLILLAWPL